MRPIETNMQRIAILVIALCTMVSALFSLDAHWRVRRIEAILRGIDVMVVQQLPGEWMDLRPGIQLAGYRVCGDDWAAKWNTFSGLANKHILTVMPTGRHPLEHERIDRAWMEVRLSECW